MEKQRPPEQVIDTGDWKAKITDFGLATIKSATTSTVSSSQKNKIGSIRWNAPELFQRGTKRSKETDIYSFGMTLWEISSRKLPFSKESDDMMVGLFIRDGEKENIPNDCPKEFSEIITKCLETNPEERPAMNKIIQILENNIQVLASKSKEISKAQEQKSEKELEVEETPGEEEYKEAILLINDDIKIRDFWKLKPAPYFSWFQANSNRSPDFLFNYGNCLDLGIGTAVDYIEAAKVYSKAADQGLAITQCYLGLCYENGEGVPKDSKRAAEQGHAKAIEALKNTR